MTVPLHDELSSGAGEPLAPLLLVYQMAKVASISWIAVAEGHLGHHRPQHVHFMASDHLAFLAQQLAEKGASQTIAHPLIVRHIYRSGLQTRALLEQGASKDRDTLVITGFRDPIARSISLLFYFADFCGHRHRTLSWRDEASVGEVEAVFIELWERVLAREPPEDTFGRILYFLFGSYATWFDDEFSRVLNIDIRRSGFAPGPNSRLARKGRTRALVYRVEDMVPESPGHSALQADLATISDAVPVVFPRSNATTTRRAEPLYRSVLDRIRLPKQILNAIYSASIISEFYLPEEIESFKRRWHCGSI